MRWYSSVTERKVIWMRSFVARRQPVNHRGARVHSLVSLATVFDVKTLASNLNTDHEIGMFRDFGGAVRSEMASECLD
jgi:hypothetical protein